ncbi:hypothetical protein MPSEU_000156100 [Mayamaea pseudoterrestris]|nr:hypothetical protein MPSEU_000156100 [Mayamaea pseudoterrestris]
MLLAQGSRLSMSHVWLLSIMAKTAMAWETKTLAKTTMRRGWTTKLPMQQQPALQYCRLTSTLKMSDVEDDPWYTDFTVDPATTRRPREQPSFGGGGRSDYGSNDRRPQYGQDRRPPRDSYGSSSSARPARGNSPTRYTRDTSRDDSQVDESAVERLIQARMEARGRRDFIAADAIRDELLSKHSVAVSDRDASWRTGASSSGSGLKYNGDQRGSSDRFGGGGDRRGRDFNEGRPRRQRDFGVNGHDYEQSADAVGAPNLSDLEDSEIHDLLAQRLRAKMSRDFKTADRIQYELLDAGVFVHDSLKEWRADGVSFSEMGGSGPRPSGRAERPERRRKSFYEQSPYSAQIDEADVDQIARMVAKRMRCKEKRQYDEADAILKELTDDYNVQVDDRLREWSVGGDFGEEANQQREMSEAYKSRGYTKSASSKSLSDANEEIVTQLVEERVQAKKNRNFDLADDIRDRLLEEFGVYIQDKSKLWSVGGDFTSEGGGTRNDAMYTRVGGGGETVTDEDLATITEMVISRSKARKDRNYDESDAISDMLYEKYKVKTDDSNKQWWIETDGFTQEPFSPRARVLNEEEVVAVENLLLERLDKKMDRDYDAADAIRDELRDLYNVEVNDRTRSWRTMEDFTSGSRSARPSPRQAQIVDDDDDDEFDDVDEDDEEHVITEASTFSTSNESEMSREELTALTIPELKEKLRVAGKPVSGKKAELVDRILE